MDTTATAAEFTDSSNLNRWQHSARKSDSGRFNHRRVQTRARADQQRIGVAASGEEGLDRVRGPRWKEMGTRLVSIVYSAVRLLNPLSGTVRSRREPDRPQSAGADSQPPARADSRPLTRADSQPLTRADSQPPARADAQPTIGVESQPQVRAEPQLARSPVKRENLKRADKQAKGAVKLLKAAQSRTLEHAEQEKLYQLTKSKQASVPARLLKDLQKAVNDVKQFNEDLKRANALLERAQNETQNKLTAAERWELCELRDSMKRTVALNFERLSAWREKLGDAKARESAAGVLVRYLRGRYLDRSSILYEPDSTPDKSVVRRIKEVIAVDIKLPIGQLQAHQLRSKFNKTKKPADVSWIFASRPKEKIEIEQFARVARHPNEDLVVVLDGNNVNAVPKDSLPKGYDRRTVYAGFRESLRKNFGECSLATEALASLNEKQEPLRTRDVALLLKACQLTQNLYPNGTKPKGKASEQIVIGAGPRTSATLVALVNFVKREGVQKGLQLLEKHDAKVEMKTTVVEKEGDNSVGRGAAWHAKQEGSANTGAEMWGHAGRLKDYFTKHWKDTIERLMPFPPALANFLSCWEAEDGSRPKLPADLEKPPENMTLRTERATASRAIVGEEEQNAAEEALKCLREVQSEILKHTWEFLYNTEVEAVKLLPPLKAGVRFKGADGNYITREADAVRMNTGTSLGSPLTEEQGRLLDGHAYIGPMCRADLGQALDNKGLLDEEGRMRQGVRILTGGTGLSLYDQLLMLDSHMGLTEYDPDSPKGWKVTEYAKKNLKGSIVITSNTPGKWISPRHTHGPEWTQDLKPISNPKEQHALFLHKDGEEIYKAWEDICVATIAAASGKTVKQARLEFDDTGELLKLQQVENKKHFDAPVKEKTKTMFGARREACLSTVLGFGFARNIKDETDKLDKLAPLTYKGRSGYIMHRAQVSAITNPDSEISKNNESLINVHNNRFQDVTASPAIIQSLAKELIDAGIAEYTTGSYANVKVAEDGSEHPLDFKDKKGVDRKFDFFVVSPTFKLTANAAERSLAEQVEPLDPEVPHIGRTDGSRFLRDGKGFTSSVENYGNASKGTRRKDGTSAGIYGYDVNNRESAVQVAQNLPYRRVAEAGLSAAGFVDPVGYVQRMYRDMIPDEKAYKEEVKKFQEHFETVMYKAALMRKAAREAGDDPVRLKEEYERYAKLNATEMKKLGRAAFAEEGKDVPEFAPAGRDDYFRRFVDAPEHIHEKVYKQALSEALLVSGGYSVAASYEFFAGQIRDELSDESKPREL